MTNDLIYQLSLTQVQHIGHVHAKILIERFGSAEAIFKSRIGDLEKTEGIGEIRARSIKRFNDFSKSEKEIAFIEKYNIKSLFLNDKDYPRRLLNCYDPPALLFYRGNADLNTSKIVAIVGTRSNTDYGKQVTEKLVKDLAPINALIVSGLAFGIDAIAHRAALKNKLETVGVVGHGLDTIYPSENTGLAKEMTRSGGLLTEFRSNTKPDKHNFPSRNRVVAGLSDATIIIETGIKGGSMITGELANSYNRDVFAIPGKITEAKSAGCNHLIKNNKAVLLTEGKELIELMGWGESKKNVIKPQTELFITLTDDEKQVVNILKSKEAVTIDELNLQSGLSTSGVAAVLLNLELQNVVHLLPGKMYALNL
jgi:DNA processing protein